MWTTQAPLAERAPRALAAAWLGGLAAIFHGRANFHGTGNRASYLTDGRTPSSWLWVRRPVTLGGWRELPQGTRWLGSLRRAAACWATRTARIFHGPPAEAPGTARPRVEVTGACAVSVRLSAQAPADFCELAEFGAYHVPVMRAEVGTWMEAGPDRFIIDGTLGGGRHSELFLAAGARVLGVDRDPEALAHARARFAAFGNRFSTWEGNFSGLGEIPEIQHGGKADGLLLDLGVSSRQLDSAARGFSFMREGPLDMRMGPSSPHTAAEVVNHWDESALVRILHEFGEEPKARRIAAAIVRQRAVRPFGTTVELAACIEGAVGRHGRTHPATRAFQAIRMAVNEELESLAAALALVPMILKPGGRLLIITFHSLEDRLVKRFLRHRSAPMVDDPGWPEPRPNPDYQFHLLARRAIPPSPEEITLNPRARSAKLRVARFIESTP